MSKLNNLTDFVTSLANAFRSKLGTTAKINPQDFDSKVTEVYSKGVHDGSTAGADALHKAFCDIFQNYGNRTDYSRAFCGEGWTRDTFKPIYDIQPTNAYYMFAYSRIYENFAKLLRDLGVTLDLSKATNIEECFAASAFKRLGIIDTTSADVLSKLFLYATSLIEINKLILRDDGSQSFHRAFGGCKKLITLNVKGVIGGTTFNVSASPLLSKASIVSIVNAVSETQATTITLSRTAVKTAFGSSTSTEWLNLRNTRPKCTVVLA